MKDIFATNVRRVLDHGQMSVNGAAHQWRVPQKTLESIIKQSRCPSLETAHAIARGAGFDLWQMLAENFDPSNPPVMQPMTPAEIEFYRKIRDLMSRSAGIVSSADRQG